ncbi:MAG: N-acetyltransferase [candidate division WOR-3 bacterium]|nr:N-acetyltransferase [candidate division WOR-3 bacterium]
MNTGFRIRPAVESDIETITSLCLEVAPFEGTGEPGGVEFYNKLFAESIPNDERLILVAESDSVIAGFVYVEVQHTPDDCTPAPYVSLDMVGVRQSHRGQGIASALMTQVESWTHEKGMKVIQLAVAESNLSAFKLYEGLGYRTVMRKMQKEL